MTYWAKQKFITAECDNWETFQSVMNGTSWENKIGMGFKFNKWGNIIKKGNKIKLMKKRLS